MNCNSAELNNIMYIIKNILNVIMIIAPILAIIMLAILFTQKVIDPDKKGSTNKIKNTFIALAVLFFIPTIVTAVMYMLGQNTEISKCYVSATKPNTNNQNYQPIEEENLQTIVNDDVYEKGYVHQLDFSCKSNYINAQFSCDTIRIVEHHYQDFNYYTKDKVISKYGGFDGYVKALGGYFEEFYNHEVQTPTKAYELQRVSEYVFGLMYIHGFDYFNGSNMESTGERVHYCKWGGSCFFLKDLAAAKEEAIKNKTELKFKYPTGSSDAFYPGQMIYGDHGYMNGKKFDQGISGKLMTTNCNNSVDMVYYKANILGTSKRPYSSADYSSQVKDKNNKIITRFEDLQIGDILHFFESSIDQNNPSTWHNWRHVAYVGEINFKTGVITAYDGGSYFTSARNHKWTFKKTDSPSKLHGYPGWVGIRVIELT